MEAINNDTAVLPTQATQSAANSAPQTTTAPASLQRTEDEDFSMYLTKLLGKTGQEEVNEEELFSSVIGQRLSEQSPEAEAFYQSKVKELSASMAREDGYVPVEDVAKAALRATVDAGKVTSAQAVQINALAFQAAQLDSNMLSLFDGRGDTKAVATMEEAMFKVKAILDRFDLGDLTLDGRGLNTPSNVGQTPGVPVPVGGEGEESGAVEKAAEHAEKAEETEEAEHTEEEGEGSEKQVRFTWKHVARDGNLAVLLPTRLNGSIEGVSLYDEEGNLIEKGDYSKRTGDNRAVFRFDEPGSAYGKNIDAVITLDNGETLTYRVDNGGKRTYVPQDDFVKNKKYADTEDDKNTTSGDAGSTPASTPSASTPTATTPDSSSPVVPVAGRPAPSGFNMDGSTGGSSDSSSDSSSSSETVSGGGASDSSGNSSGSSSDEKPSDSATA